MPFYTVEHCCICYKLDRDANNQALPRTLINKKNEICHRFGILSSRYLDLDDFHFRPQRTVNTKLEINYDTVCDSCVEMLESFCNIYQQVQYLTLQLNWRLHEISEVMRIADKPDSKKFKYRKIFHEKLTENDPQVLEDIDDFRTEFIERAEERMKKMTPWLTKDGTRIGIQSLPKEDLNQQEQDLSTEPKKIEVETPALSPPSARPKELFKKSPKKHRFQRPIILSLGPVEDKEEEDYDDLFTIVKRKKSKKRKRTHREKKEAKSESKSRQKYATGDDDPKPEKSRSILGLKAGRLIAMMEGSDHSKRKKANDTIEISSDSSDDDDNHGHQRRKPMRGDSSSGRGSMVSALSKYSS